MKGNCNPFFYSSKTNVALRLLFGAFLTLLCIPHLATAQDAGYIRGTVTDKSGAAVAGAEVVITSVGGNLSRDINTNADGAYAAPALPGGTYDITVTAKGFQKFQAKAFVLAVAQKAYLDVELTVGPLTEEVIVTGENVAQVDTSSAELAGTINGKQINQLILNGRNFTQLINLVPGVVNQTGQDEGTVGVFGNVAYAINGGRTEYNNWEIDGGDNMDNGSNSTLNVYPNIEAIAEFKVLTSNYGAQYGRNASGTIEVETKSGTSAFHGSAFYYGRNEAFNARSWEQGADPTQPKARYRKHDYGYTIGGPVFIPHHYNTDKKKTFFFWSQEWRKESNPTTILQNVPSDAERGLVGGIQTGFGNFSDLCPGADCPNVPDPTTVPISSVGQQLLALIPVANTTTSNFPAVLQTISAPTAWREPLIRVDQNITDNYRLTFRYIHDDARQTLVPTSFNAPGSFLDISTQLVGPGTSFVARLTAKFTLTLLNEFVASYTGDHIFFSTTGNPALPSFFAMGSLFPGQNPLFGGKLPAIQLKTNTSYGGDFGQDTGFFPWKNANPTYTYRDNMTWIKGNHTMQFGAYLALAQKNEANAPNLQGILTFDTSSPVSTGNSFADLLTGKIANYHQWSTQVQYYNRYRIFEPYFQDDWRVRKKLTLNLGLRVSLFGTYRERYRQAYNFNPTGFDPSQSPAIDTSGTATDGTLVPGFGNPFNNIIQCGASGGNGAVPAPILAAFPTAGVGGSSNPGCQQSHLFNPAPRIGFAWDPKGDGKMAVRGGYGIFFEHTNGNEGNTESLEGSPPLVLEASQFNVAGYENVGGGLLFPLAVNSIPDKAVWPYVQQWNLSIQKELPAHFVLSAAYVGSKGTHLTLLNNINQIHPVAASANPYLPGEPIGANGHDDCGTLTTPSGIAVTGQAAVNLGVACGGNPDPRRTAFPGYGNISGLRDTANSAYNALQVSANRTVGALTLSVAYTYSHSIDGSSDRFDRAFVNSYDVAANRASSNFDQRQNLAISYVYALPFFQKSGLKNSIFGGWQISGITIAQTGTPVSVINGTTIGDNAGVGNGVGTGSRPDLIGNPSLVSSSDQARSAAAGVRGRLFANPGAYALATGLTFGNVGRNTLYLPGRLNFDFGVFKRFPIRENMGFQFRWEMFNIFNHTQYNGINNSMDCAGTTANFSASASDCIQGVPDPSNPGSFLTAPSQFLHLSGAHAPRIMQFGVRFYF